MTRADVAATAGRALRATGRGLWRAAVYLGPLLLAALGYLARLCADAVSAVRGLMLRRGRDKARVSASEYEQLAAALQDAKAKRWTAWRALPDGRRLAVRTAAVALALSALVAARTAWLPATDSTATDSTATASTSAAARPESASSPPTGTSDIPAADIHRAAAQFAADRGRIAPGEWALLYEPPVLAPARLGAWDDFRVGSPVVMKEDAGGVFGRGPQYRMWYLGCHLAMSEHRCGIGHAASADGIAWEKHPQAVFVPTDPIVQDNLYEISVVKTGVGYWLWYSVAADQFSGRPRATVNLATSPDGLVWTDQGQVLEGTHTWVIEHSVFHDGQRFHMWYVTPTEDAGAPVLQHLSSADGKAWTPLGGTPLDKLEQNLEPFGRLMVETNAKDGFRALFARAPGAQHVGVMGALVSRDGTTWRMEAVKGDPVAALFEARGLSVRAGASSGTNDRDGLWLWISILPDHIALAFRKGS